VYIAIEEIWSRIIDADNETINQCEVQRMQASRIAFSQTDSPEETRFDHA
jgi:hypothetical protein